MTKTSPLISFIIPIRHGSSTIQNTVSQLEIELKRLSLGFEILLIPNHSKSDHNDGSEELCHRLDSENVRTIDHQGKTGKGAALRTGFLQAKGNYIFFTDADLPYGVSPIQEMLECLKSGVDFVSANRRHPDSRFLCSVEVLPKVYRRHRMSLLFNFIARILFGISARDTQAGLKGFSRPLLKAILEKQTCPGFLSDLEYFVVCHDNGFKKMQVPVTFTLIHEKSTIRILNETLTSVYWFTRIFLQRLLGHYQLKNSEYATSVS